MMYIAAAASSVGTKINLKQAPSHLERCWDASFGPGNVFCSRNHQPRRLTKIYRGSCRTKAQSRCITQIMMYIAAAASSVGTKNQLKASSQFNAQRDASH